MALLSNDCQRLRDVMFSIFQVFLGPFIIIVCVTLNIIIVGTRRCWARVAQWAAPGANRCWFASALRIKVLARTPPCFSTGCSLSHTGSHAHCAYSLRHAECRARFSWLCCGLGPYVLIGLGIMLLSLPITGRLSRDMMGKTMAKLKFADERTRVCEV
jgi:hypothetical protein